MKLSVLILFITSTLAQAQLHVVNPNTKSNFTMPNASLTPGDVLTTDKNTVCKVGYTKTVRNVPAKLKRQVMTEYHKNDSISNYEIDHLIPLELGGSNSIKNLWPQPLSEAHLKDGLEDRLHSRVCHDGSVLLKDAQRAIAKDWTQLYKNYVQPQEGQH